MRRSCQACGRPFEAKVKHAKFCGATCRSRAHRGAKVTELRPELEQLGAAPTVVASTRQLLEDADRLNTPAGAASMVIAAKLDAGGDTGSAVAALVRELRAAVAEATSDVSVRDDPLDDIARKRRERQARAGA